MQKNTTLHFKVHCTKIDDILLILKRFIFYQTNLVYKSNPVFNDILDSFFTLKFLPFDYQYSTDFDVHPVPLHLSIKNQENSDEILCSFLRFSVLECSYYVLFTMIRPYMLTAKVNPGVNKNSL